MSALIKFVLLCVNLDHLSLTAAMNSLWSLSILTYPCLLSLLSLSTVDRLKDLNIGNHLPRRHRSSRGVKRKKQNLHSFIVASFNAQSVKGNEMACMRCEISTFIKDNGVDLFL